MGSFQFGILTNSIAVNNSSTNSSFRMLIIKNKFVQTTLIDILKNNLNKFFYNVQCKLSSFMCNFILNTKLHSAKLSHIGIYKTYTSTYLKHLPVSLVHHVLYSTRLCFAGVFWFSVFINFYIFLKKLTRRSKMAE